MKKQKLSTRETVMIVFLVVLLIAVVYYMGFLTPLQTELARIEGEINNLQTQQESYQEKLAQMNKMETELEELKKIPAEKLTEIAPYDNMVEVLLSLDRYLDVNSETYTLNFDEPEVAEEGTVRRVVKMAFTCKDYNSARSMVDDLTGNKWRCLVGNTIIEAEEEDANIQNNVVNVSLEVTFFELSDYTA